MPTQVRRPSSELLAQADFIFIDVQKQLLHDTSGSHADCAACETGHRILLWREQLKSVRGFTATPKAPEKSEKQPRARRRRDTSPAPVNLDPMEESLSKTEVDQQNAEDFIAADAETHPIDPDSIPF